MKLKYATSVSLFVMTAVLGSIEPCFSFDIKSINRDAARAIRSIDVSPGASQGLNSAVPRTLQKSPEQPTADVASKPPSKSPFVMPNSMIIMFQGDVSPADVENYISEKGLNVVQKYENTGAIQVQTDLTKFFSPKLSDKSQNDTISRGLSEAIQEFTADHRVQSASPDILLSQKELASADVDLITNVLKPSEVVSLAAGKSGADETSDWGLADIEAEELWKLPGAQDGAVFGVMDVGFSRHDDLTFSGFPRDSKADNHGNHVAGIGCARHNNFGTKGVIPNCHVKARSGDVFFKSVEGGAQLGFMVLFSQILSTLDRFVSESEEVQTFNVSLGYNWRSNFDINPDLPDAMTWRVLVESQGTMLVRLLDVAGKKGKVIFSAAGNDSAGLASPISAKYASPFNWAALVAREKGISSSGIIVGAHGPDGKRAKFANVGGHISCPGVNIFSLLAFDETGKPSSGAYGKMSGTSMAAPYCSSAHVLFRLVRANYSGTEAADCMIATGQKMDDGVPRLKLKSAIEACQ